MKKKSTLMEIVNPHAAGIDVGSRSHYVAVGQGADQVREFGVYEVDLRELTRWLLDQRITTVAMESTGAYWQNLFATLQGAGLQVLLCNGKFTKNIKGRKTDVQDCQWIQRLHSLGLLTGSFLPDKSTEELRTYCRHRTSLLETAAVTTQKMHKYLRLLNLRLDVVVRKVTGQTGMAIIEAICRGETDPEKLACFRHGNCRKSKEEIARALHGNGRRDLLFALSQELEIYKVLQEKIAACDEAIEKLLLEQIEAHEEKRELKAEAKPYKRVNKNAPQQMDLNQLAFQYFNGVDLLKIEGVSHSTVIALMSEVGPEGIRKFGSAKQFSNWLRLCPNTKVSGGRVLSSHIPKGSNRLKIALRNAANAIGNLRDTHLSDFFRRVAFRKGRQAAVSATARKLAVIIWNMLSKGVQYQPPTQYLFLDEKRKLKLVQRIKKNIAKLDLKPEDVGFETA
ncbi:IS110 family transposase [Pontibacter sp. 172403-2]|uniref:IS110 family transposase n=1 Tax=Pontibacter rufus TaxID=2791028 RepID=UPI0018AFDBD9|nr:IS110 family transposase [Pontibacter sp. 172403-2]MBF9255766.1 IS110 family transposase [Pontibacter sp. 172403-2]